MLFSILYDIHDLCRTRRNAKTFGSAMNDYRLQPVAGMGACARLLRERIQTARAAGDRPEPENLAAWRASRAQLAAELEALRRQDGSLSLAESASRTLQLNEQVALLTGQIARAEAEQKQKSGQARQALGALLKDADKVIGIVQRDHVEQHANRVVALLEEYGIPCNSARGLLSLSPFFAAGRARSDQRRYGLTHPQLERTLELLEQLAGEADMSKA
jgi:uncharacterized small protein (DUF1192 family)